MENKHNSDELRCFAFLNYVFGKKTETFEC